MRYQALARLVVDVSNLEKGAHMPVRGGEASQRCHDSAGVWHNIKYGGSGPRQRLERLVQGLVPGFSLAAFIDSLGEGGGAPRDDDCCRVAGRTKPLMFVD